MKKAALIAVGPDGIVCGIAATNSFKVMTEAIEEFMEGGSVRIGFVSLEFARQVAFEPLPDDADVLWTGIGPAA